MGEPSRGHALLPAPESIRCEEATGGTETSKYPEERKSNRDSGSSGERNRTKAQTRARASDRALLRGGCGASHPESLLSRAELQSHTEAERHGKAGRSG